MSKTYYNRGIQVGALTPQETQRMNLANSERQKHGLQPYTPQQYEQLIHPRKGTSGIPVPLAGDPHFTLYSDPYGLYGGGQPGLYSKGQLGYLTQLQQMQGYGGYPQPGYGQGYGYPTPQMGYPGYPQQYPQYQQPFPGMDPYGMMGYGAYTNMDPTGLGIDPYTLAMMGY